MYSLVTNVIFKSVFAIGIMNNYIFASLFRKDVLLNADVAKLVDALDLGSSAARRGGSSPSIRTTRNAIQVIRNRIYLTKLGR